MNDDGEDSVAVGAEEARRAAVLRPLVQAYLNGTGSLERGINDAVWELGVSRATVWLEAPAMVMVFGAPAVTVSVLRTGVVMAW